MGTVDSKEQMPSPETPQYRKYSHLKEIEDPRSPVTKDEQPRTPILTVDKQTKMVDPRSPTAVPRTPIFCIPEPEFEEIKEASDDVKSFEEISPGVEEKKTEGKEPEDEFRQIAEPDQPIGHVESSPEKTENLVEFSDKGYLINKNKKASGTNKKRRRRRNKKPKNDENSGSQVMIPQKTFKVKAHEGPKRSPLATRNFVLYQCDESPSMELLIKNTKKLSMNVKPKMIDFNDIEDIGKENLAATFSP